MAEKRISWETFKSLVISKNTAFTCIEDDPTRYNLYMSDLGTVYGTFILREDPKNAEQIEFETLFKAKSNKPSPPMPFAAKVVGDKKLFRRLHGQTFTLLANTNTIVDFTVPYGQCKIDKCEILWAPEGIRVDLEIYDTSAGTYSTIPNYKLNQFGFDVNLRPEFYEDTSKYDADLYVGMIVRLTFKNSTAVTKTCGINYVLHELRT